MQLDGSGAMIAYIVYIYKTNVPVYLEKGGRTYRLLTDPLGSPSLLVDTTDGTIVQRLAYEAFGQVLAIPIRASSPLALRAGCRSGTRDGYALAPGVMSRV